MRGLPAFLGALLLIAPLFTGDIVPSLPLAPTAAAQAVGPVQDPCPEGNALSECAHAPEPGSACVAEALLARGAANLDVVQVAATNPPGTSVQDAIVDTNPVKGVAADVAFARCEFPAEGTFCAGMDVRGVAEVTGVHLDVAGIRVDAEVLREEGCTSGGASFNRATITRLDLPNVPLTFDTDTLIAPNTLLMVTPTTFLILDERVEATNADGTCRWNSGSALRLVVLNPFQEIRIAWVSTMVCDGPFTPTVSTTALPAPSVTLGTAIADRATVAGPAGAFVPTGTVRFFVCTPAQVVAGVGCPAGGSQVGPAVPLDGAGQAVSASFPTTATGTHCWRAEYAGDAHYLPATHTNFGSECVTVQKLTPTISTTSNPTGTVFIGTQARDTAAVSGSAGTPTGTVTFFLCNPTTGTITPGVGCTSGGLQIGPAKTLVGGTATSDLTGVNTAVGNHCWRAQYSGDAVYNAASHTNFGSECFTQQKRTASIATQAHWQDPAFSSLTFDRAWVNATSGGPAPTGTVTFFLCGPFTTPTACSSGGSFQGTRTLTGSFVDSTKFDDATLADFRWFCYRAEYSGDANYLPSVHFNTTSECFFTLRPQ